MARKHTSVQTLGDLGQPRQPQYRGNSTRDRDHSRATCAEEQEHFYEELRGIQGTEPCGGGRRVIRKPIGGD